jgi:hypothetical protein
MLFYFFCILNLLTFAVCSSRGSPHGPPPSRITFAGHPSLFTAAIHLIIFNFKFKSQSAPAPPLYHNYHQTDIHHASPNLQTAHSSPKFQSVSSSICLLPSQNPQLIHLPSPHHSSSHLLVPNPQFTTKHSSFNTKRASLDPTINNSPSPAKDHGSTQITRQSPNLSVLFITNPPLLRRNQTVQHPIIPKPVLKLPYLCPHPRAPATTILQISKSTLELQQGRATAEK